MRVPQRWVRLSASADDASQEVLWRRKWERGGHLGKKSYRERGVTADEYAVYWHSYVNARWHAHGGRARVAALFPSAENEEKGEEGEEPPPPPTPAADDGRVPRPAPLVDLDCLAPLACNVGLFRSVLELPAAESGGGRAVGTAAGDEPPPPPPLVSDAAVPAAPPSAE